MVKYKKIFFQLFIVIAMLLIYGFIFGFEGAGY